MTLYVIRKNGILKSIQAKCVERKQLYSPDNHINTSNLRYQGDGQCGQNIDE